MLQVIAAILLISLIPVMVGFLTLAFPSFNTKAPRYLVSFAAGIMLGNSFFDLLPESIEQSNVNISLTFALLGITLFFLMEKYFLWHCHSFGTHSHKNTTFLVMTGDTLHNFIDGIVVAGAFLASPFLGLTTTLAITLHEIPQELADFSVLVSDGIKPKRAILLNFLSGLVALGGGILGYLFLTPVMGIVPYFTAFAAGMFIYISCSDLIPKTHDLDKKNFEFNSTFLLIVGLLAIRFLSSNLH